MRDLLVLMIAVLSGCATVEPIATSKTTFAVCKAADVATTTKILHAGGTELNPAMRAILGAPPYNFVPLAAVSLGMWALLEWADNRYATLAANAITCPVAVHNGLQMVK